MAKVKNSTETPTTPEKVIKKDNVALEELLKELKSLKEQTNAIIEKNELLEEENKTLKNSLTELSKEKEAALTVSNVSTSEKEVTIVHTIQHSNGLTTYMKIGDLEIVMRNMGERRTLTKQQFEMMVGTYRHFFDMGFVALDSSQLELAEAYGIDCYNPNDKTQFTASTIKNLGKASLDELEEIFKNLSEPSKKNFLNYWLNKAYEKEEGFYDKAKMGQLDRLAQTNLFAHIIATMD